MQRLHGTRGDNESTARLKPIEADALAGLTHGFFTREGGVSEGIYASLNAGPGSRDMAGAVAENRRRIATALGLRPHRLLSMNQVHSADVVTVTKPFAERPKADALVTATPGLALAVLTADCAPVLLADRNSGVVGAAHAGWRGAAGGILEAAVGAMTVLGAHPEAMTAVVGPTIAQASYEVGADMRADVLSASPDAEDLFAPAGRVGHFMFDLPGYACRRLAAAGVGAVHQLGLDTYADPERFFSWRRAVHRGEGDYGRLLSAIMAGS